MNYFYTLYKRLYRRIVAAIFAHLSTEFRAALKSDLERICNVAEQASAKAEAIEQAIHAIECNAQIDRLERVLSQALPQRLDAPKAISKVVCKG